VALLLLTTVATTRIFVDPRLAKQDWRGAFATVHQARQPGDLVVLHHATSIVPAIYYEPPANKWASVPSGSDDHSWSLILGQTTLEPWNYLFPASSGDPWADVLGTSSPGRLWLIYLDPTMSNHAVTMSRPWDIFAEADEATVAWLGAHRDRVLEHHSFAGVDVLLVGLSP
jgi:hypothetical protein